MAESANTRFRNLVRESKEETLVSNVADPDFAHDLHAVACMVEEGYDVTEIMSALRRSLQGRPVSASNKSVSIYVDKVMDQVNQQLTRNMLSNYTLARNELRRLIDSQRMQYRDLGDDFFSTYRKGNILIQLVVREGFHPDTVEAVVRQGKDIPFENDEEIRNIMESVRNIAEKYREIDEIQIKSAAQTPKAVYLQYAKEYMRDTKSSVLSMRDEQKIIGSMHYELEHLYREKLPKASEKTGRAELETLIERDLKPFCRRALAAGSPVADEPGRDRKQYLEAVLSGSVHFANRMRPKNEQYEMTRQRFLAFRNEMELEEQMRAIIPAGAVLDCELAKRMINDEQNEDLVLRVIAENSKELEAQRLLADGDRALYAKRILASAKESCRREKEISYADMKPIPDHATLSELTEQHISVQDLYVHTLRERLDVNPSFRTRLSADFTDVDACARLMTRFKDISPQALSDAIEECSPRQAILGAPKDYASRTVRRAQAELRAALQREEKMRSLQTEFNRSRGFASEGIHDNVPMNDYKDGKAAVQMLLKNVPVEDVQRLIAKIAPQGREDIPPMRYAATVVAAARDVLFRAKRVEEYQPEETSYGKVDRMYMELAHKYQKAKDFPDTATDIRIFMQLKMDDVPERDITQAIIDHSPSAAEFGRTAESYAAFVQASANHRLEEEIKKLDNYICIPREDHEESAAEEYNYHLKKIKDYISLPFSPKMDKKITRALIQQDFSDEAIAKMLNGHSELAKTGLASGQDYGKDLVRSVRSGMKTERKKTDERTETTEERKPLSHGMEEIRVRTRTYETYEEKSEEDE